MSDTCQELLTQVKQGLISGGFRRDDVVAALRPWMGCLEIEEGSKRDLLFRIALIALSEIDRMDEEDKDNKSDGK